MSPENFNAEQGKISAVEQKAGVVDKETKQKINEQLSKELQAQHAIFFNQVDDTAKTFSKAEQLKDPAAKAEMDKDKAEIKSLLLSAATSGESILASKEQNPNLSTIRQSAARISTLTASVEKNLSFFQNLDAVVTDYNLTTKPFEEMHQVADLLKEPDAQKQGKLMNLMDQISFGLTDEGLIDRLDYCSKADMTPEMKAQLDSIKARIKSRMDEVSDLRIKYSKEFEAKSIKPEEQQIIDIREGKGQPNGTYGVGYNEIGSLIEKGKKAGSDERINALASELGSLPDAIAQTEAEAKGYFQQAKSSAEKVSAALNGIDAEK